MIGRNASVLSLAFNIPRAQQASNRAGARVTIIGVFAHDERFANLVTTCQQPHSLTRPRSRASRHITVRGIAQRTNMMAVPSSVMTAVEPSTENTRRRPTPGRVIVRNVRATGSTILSVVPMTTHSSAPSRVSAAPNPPAPTIGCCSVPVGRSITARSPRCFRHR
jgi:hypothetical protein